MNNKKEDWDYISYVQVFRYSIYAIRDSSINKVSTENKILVDSGNPKFLLCELYRISR